MKIQCRKEDLLGGVNIALKAVPLRSTMPILECIIVEASDLGIKLTTNDMEIGIETFIKGTITENGTVALNAKIFSEIVRRLPDNDVYINVDQSFMTEIICEKAYFSISGKSGDEFPFLPDIDKNKKVILSQFTLREIIKQTVFSISDNDSMKYMMGELFEIKANELRVTSLDGHRVSIRKVYLKDVYDDIKVIIPGKTLYEVSKILSGEVTSYVNIYFTDKHALFEFDDTIVLTRLIEGDFLRIDHMLSNDYETMVTINKKELLNCIERASLLIRETDKKPVIIDIKNSGFELKINTSMGSMKEKIDIKLDGKDITIGFNPKYLLDALHAIDDESVDIYFINSKAPCYIRDREQSYTYLIVQVNINIPI
jgi:DNA polymerase-3 subunit beta